MSAVCMLAPAGLGAAELAGLSLGFAERAGGGGDLHDTQKVHTVHTLHTLVAQVTYIGCLSCISWLHKLHNWVA